MDNIDDLVTDQQDRENRQSSEERSSSEIAGVSGYGGAFESEERQYLSQNRIFVGVIEHFFSRINVAAITLEGDLKVGDMIEIEGSDDVVRQRISSMQINKEDVETASVGDDVGIKVDCQISEGSRVYVIS
jgi:putative protease